MRRTRFRVDARDVSSLLPQLPPSPLFAQLPPSSLATFLTHFHQHWLPCETLLFDRNDTRLVWCVVLSGSMAVFRDDECQCVLRRHDSFGLSALLEGKPRQATFIAVDECELLTITRDDYHAFLSATAPRQSPYIRPIFEPLVMDAVKAIIGQPHAIERNSDDIALLSALLTQSSRLFQSCDALPLARLSSHLYLATADTGDVIVQQGEYCEHLFIVLDGACSVHRRDEQSTSATVRDNRSPMTSRPSTRGSRRQRPQSPHPNANNHQSKPVTSTVHHKRQRDAKLTAITDEFGEVSPAAEQLTFISARALKPQSLVQEYGPCHSLLLPCQATAFDDSVLAPTFTSRHSSTVIAKQPTTLAYVSASFLCYVLSSFHKFHSSYNELTQAAAMTKGRRTEEQITVLDSLLKSLNFFQFKQSRARRALCQCLTVLSVPSDRLLHRQGEPSDQFYIVLSGSVSSHTKNDDDTNTSSNTNTDTGPGTVTASAGRRSVAHVQSLVDQFGLCTTVARPMTSINESALLSPLPRSSTLITRTVTELLCLSRADYVAVCEPSSELSSHSDLISTIMRKKDTERTADESQLLTQALLHFHYLNEIRADIRPMVLASLTLDTVEAEMRLFEEGDQADSMYIIVTGCVAVHLADRKNNTMKTPRANIKTLNSPISGSGMQLPGLTALASTQSPTGASSRVNGMLSARQSQQGRVSVAHLTPSEISNRYGPQVTLLPAGSHFGDLAFAHPGSTEGHRRSATILTVEPCLFLKLPKDLVLKINFMQSAMQAGSSKASGLGRESMTQANISAFLASLPLFAPLASSLAAMKRLAFHTQSRHYKQGDTVIVQGEKPEGLITLVEGEVRLTRNYSVKYGKAKQNRKPLRDSHTSGAKKRAATSVGVSEDGDEHDSGANGGTSSNDAFLDHYPQQLHQPHCVLYSPLLFPGDEFPLVFPLSTLGALTSVGAYECLSAVPLSYRVTVTSATLHVLTVKRSHFLAFINNQFKAIETIHSETLKRRQWHYQCVTEEIKRQVTARLKTADDVITSSSTSAALLLQAPPSTLPSDAGRFTADSLQMQALCTRVTAHNIPASAAAFHSARLTYLSEQDDDHKEAARREAEQAKRRKQRGGGDAESEAAAQRAKLSEVEQYEWQQRDAAAAVMALYVHSVSKHGIVRDSQSQKKLGRTLARVQRMIDSNEDKQRNKAKSLSRIRQTLVKPSVDDADASDEGDTHREAGLQAAESSGESMICETAGHEDFSVESALQAMALAHHSDHAEHSVARAIDASMPSHLHPVLRLPFTLRGHEARTVPSIPHSTLTREEIEEIERLKQNNSANSKIAKGKGGATSHLLHDGQWQEEKTSVSNGAAKHHSSTVSLPAIHPIGYRSFADWQAERALRPSSQSSSRSSTVGIAQESKEMFDDSVEEETTQDDSLALLPTVSPPSTKALLQLLERCQEDTLSTDTTSKLPVQLRP